MGSTTNLNWFAGFPPSTVYTKDERTLFVGTDGRQVHQSSNLRKGLLSLFSRQFQNLTKVGCVGVSDGTFHDVTPDFTQVKWWNHHVLPILYNYGFSMDFSKKS